jgi:hypothetical protein
MATSEKVPLFIAKTSILSQRSSGYVNTHSAVNEFLDNSIEAGAKRVYVYYLPRRQGNSARRTGRGDCHNRASARIAGCNLSSRQLIQTIRDSSPGSYDHAGSSHQPPSYRET